MKPILANIAAGGFAVATAMGVDVNRAEADADIASNSQLKGQYAGTSSGGCLVSLSGFDDNDRPIDQTRTYSNMFTTDVVFTFDGYGSGNADFLAVVTNSTWTQYAVSSGTASRLVSGWRQFYLFRWPEEYRYYYVRGSGLQKPQWAFCRSELDDRRDCPRGSFRSQRGYARQNGRRG
jgi:hypothetical protein